MKLSNSIQPLQNRIEKCRKRIYSQSQEMNPTETKKKSRSVKSHYGASYMIPFWVGLMDGDGSIQVNHWRKRSLQYRMVIRLRENPENIEMLHRVREHVGGRVVTQRGFVLWVEDTRRKIVQLLQILQKGSITPLTTRLLCQIDFALQCLEGVTIDWYLEHRKQKYNQRLLHVEPCQARIQHWLQKHGQRQQKEGVGSTGAVGVGVYQATSFQAWLSGFIEAEGCFSYSCRYSGRVAIAKEPNARRMSSVPVPVPTRTSWLFRFSIGQKDDFYLLEGILLYFGSSQTRQVIRRKNDFFEIEISRRVCLQRFYDHFQLAPLVGWKRVQFERFWKFYQSEVFNQ